MRRLGRRNARGQSTRRAPAPGPSPLLDYALDTTLSRTSEAALSDLRDGWAWGSPPWPGPATHRVFGDGAILIEGSRTNVLVRSEEPGDAAWLSHLGASGSNGTATAPDGDGDAGTVSFPADPDAALYQTPAIADGTTVTLSAWLRGSGAVRLAVRQRDGSTVAPSANLLLTSQWVRHTFTVSVGTGAADPRVMLLNGSDGAARTVDVGGVQCEEGGFATSYIRTAGVAATRGGEVCTLADADVPAVMRTGRWAFDIWLPYSHADIQAGYRFFMNWGNVGGVGLYRSGAAMYLAPFINNGGLATQTVVNPTFAPGSKITITLDTAALAWGVSGLMSGNATGLSMANMTSDNAAGNSTVANGIVSFGGRRAAGGSQWADGILSQPRAL